MRIKFVTGAEIKVELEAYPGWNFHAKKWYGLYYTQPIPEIWINKEENLFGVIQTLFHEIGHWFMDLAGLDRFNLHYEILTHFFNLTELPKDKHRSMSAYYSEIKKAPFVATPPSSPSSTPPVSSALSLSLFDDPSLHKFSMRPRHHHEF